MILMSIPSLTTSKIRTTDRQTWADQKIRLNDLRLHLHRIARPVADGPHNIIFIAHLIDDGFVTVNHHDIIPLLAEHSRQFLADLTASHNNNLHSSLPYSCSSVSNINFSSHKNGFDKQTYMVTISPKENEIHLKFNFGL